MRNGGQGMVRPVPSRSGVSGFGGVVLAWPGWSVMDCRVESRRGKAVLVLVCSATVWRGRSRRSCPGMAGSVSSVSGLGEAVEAVQVAVCLVRDGRSRSGSVRQVAMSRGSASRSRRSRYGADGQGGRGWTGETRLFQSRQVESVMALWASSGFAGLG